MTDNNHPITPPRELVQEWIKECDRTARSMRWHEFEQDIANRAAQWGADTELTECCKCIYDQGWFTDPSLRIAQLRTARRPKPPSLKEQALAVVENSEICDHLSIEHADILRRALESLPD